MAEPNHKMERFAFEYAIDGHGTNSALRAGYAEAGAAAQATKLLQNPKVLELIEHHKRAAAALATTSLAEIISELRDMAFTDRTEIVRLVSDPCLNCYDQATRQAMKAAGLGRMTEAPNPECQLCRGKGIERVEMTPTAQLSKRARKLVLGYEQKKDGIKVSMVNPVEMLREICKILGYYAPEKKELGGSVQISHEIKAPSLMTDEELDAIYRRNQLKNSVEGVLEGVFLELPPVTDDSKEDAS